MKVNKTTIKLFVFTAIILSIAFVNTSLISRAVMAVCNTVVVKEGDVAIQPENTPPTKNWILYTRNAGTGAFRTGPATPPAGVGSFEITTPTGADKATLFNFDHVGTPLSSVNELRYSTYRTAGNLQQVAALNIQVDVNGADPGGFTTLVFEPVYNTDQGAVVSGQWQNWDAYNGGNGIWWSSNPIPSAPNRDTFVSWDTIVAANPNAVIVGGVGINQGSGNPALVTAVDKFSVGYGAVCFTYNFDPFEVPETAAACKNGGWQTLRRANGSTFKNQGDCIQYVNTGR